MGKNSILWEIFKQKRAQIKAAKVVAENALQQDAANQAQQHFEQPQQAFNKTIMDALAAIDS